MRNFRAKNWLPSGLLAVFGVLPALPGGAAAAFKLPDTGQSTCYNASGTVIACAASGQDGDHIVNPMSYTVNIRSDCALDNALKCTVTDDNTGLVWQSYATSKFNWFQSSGTFQGYSNPDPVRDICGELSLGGYTDWRMPTRKELLSIVDYSVPDPGPTVNAASFLPTVTSSYWSYNSASSGYMSKAWGVEFGTGKTVTDYRDYASMYLRCVRGTQSLPGFVNNLDGTITDSTTGLVWQQAEPGAKTWSGAISYCGSLTLANHDDWRLPNVRELASLVDDGKSATTPALDTAFFPNVASANYWSSTSYATTPSAAWVVGFSNGGTDAAAKSASLNCRCVRSGIVTPVVLPTVTTASVSTITATTATGGGNVTSAGGGTVSARGVCWGTSANPTTSGSCVTAGSGTGSFTAALSGLSSKTPYHVRAYAVNSAGTAYGADATFTTASAPPTVSTAAVTTITTTTASSGGNVASDGGETVTSRGICWGTSSNPTTADSHSTDGSGTGSFTSAISGLTPYTTYHVRAYATNAGGTGYGDDLYFTTLCPSEVARNGATPYGTLQGAVSAGTGTAEIRAKATVVVEDLLVSGSRNLTLLGGYDCVFTNVIGVTTVNGTVTIGGNATVTMADVTVY